MTELADEFFESVKAYHVRQDARFAAIHARLTKLEGKDEPRWFRNQEGPKGALRSLLYRFDNPESVKIFRLMPLPEAMEDLVPITLQECIDHPALTEIDGMEAEKLIGRNPPPEIQDAEPEYPRWFRDSEPWPFLYRWDSPTEGWAIHIFSQRDCSTVWKHMETCVSLPNMIEITPAEAEKILADARKPEIHDADCCGTCGNASSARVALGEPYCSVRQTAYSPCKHCSLYKREETA